MFFLSLVCIDGADISPSTQATHVGVVRSAEGNGPNILARLSAHRLLRLHQATPDPVVFLLAGCLPFQALLHLGMISLFGQLCRLRDGDNILVRHASSIFSSASSSSKSWFWKLRQICLMYSLPHPSSWLNTKPSKLQVKQLAKAAVRQYWLVKLRVQADSLTSLRYLRTGFLGLVRCHPLFWTCGASPREVEKALPRPDSYQADIGLRL